MVARLLEFAANNRSAFGQSSVSGSEAADRIDPSIRISHCMKPVTEIEPMVEARVGEALGDVFAALGCASFTPSMFEVEMVAHGDGAFFRRHIDTFTGSADTAGESRRAARVVSMVYYFCATPARFSGGQLRLHSLAATGDPGTYVDIEPVNDTALFFPSWFPHEVLPVVCESGRFMDSRFAINCWVYK